MVRPSLRAALCLLAIALLLPLPAGTASPQILQIISDDVAYQTNTGLDGPLGEERRITTRLNDSIYVEIFWPDSWVFPGKVPVILMMTPYAFEDYAAPAKFRHMELADVFRAHGYAVAIAHVPGTGHSTGCLDTNSPNEIEATTSVIEALAADNRTTGHVGMYGLSYAAIVQIGVASLGDPARIAGLKAIIPVAGFAGEYDALAFDGVPTVAMIGTYVSGLYSGYGAVPSPEVALASNRIPVQEDRFTCRPAVAVASAEMDATGARGQHWATRDARDGVQNVRAAVLWASGLRDPYVPPHSVSGWFDALPSSTPHKAVISQLSHGFPDRNDVPGLDKFTRSDWMDLALAWFEEHVKGNKMGTSKWPDVQLQDSDARWRAVHNWPYTGGRAGHLALSDAGLGGRPAGETLLSVAQPSHTWRLAPLERPLHVTGLPVADLWISTAEPDVRLVVQMTGYDAAGNRLDMPWVGGARAVKYRQPMAEGWFDQGQPDELPAGAFRLPVRMQPTDFIVPAGGSLELVIGIIDAGCDPRGFCMSTPKPGMVTVHHGCEAASVLRFEMPAPGEKNLTPGPGATVQKGTPDGGIAQHKVCGQRPLVPGDVVRGLA